ncbi:hypothetical protein [Kitasatospora aburaviensis]|uniref:Lipoprotein n=1 Tax=Kitasatospora aburaviensis TaxID=67265 RepID=A0ABW1F5H3_9ACTN
MEGTVFPRLSRRVCVLGLAGLLMSGCSAGGSSVEASRDDVVGAWTNHKGARLVIEPGGTFRSESIAKAVSLQDGCAQSLAAGKWLLLGDRTQVARTSDPKGSTISLMPGEVACNWPAASQRASGRTTTE